MAGKKLQYSRALRGHLRPAADVALHAAYPSGHATISFMMPSPAPTQSATCHGWEAW